MSLGSIRVHDLLRAARARRASDVHFGGLERPALRVDGRLVGGDAAPIDDAAARDFLTETLVPEQLARLDARGTADGGAAPGAAGSPYRVHAYRHAGGVRVAVRLLAERIPSLDQLGLPAAVASLAARGAGLVLFTGPTGSGKTTALAALIDRINRTAERTICTIEDPVEYVHVPARSLITQCEIGRDVADFDEALRGFLRADPDVILVGEMRDRATMEAALTAAETGHLVFATLHTNDAAQTVDRIIDAFPPEAHAQVRSQLAAVLAAIVALRLVPRRDGAGRRAAAEILIGTDAVRALIREGKTHMLRNTIVTGRASGMQTLETHLCELVVRGEVTLADAQAVSSRPAEVRAFERSAS
ncbi:twitching motility protein PilT [Vulcanimicrobium alpinum]|uniref:Twitching motility protein PilT n=1 Tax=Vulcanimicrobium alpinum TaxID=3016050 RepID=A0AAN2CA19_UNVUL|nr:PilT/PilU family type 4a pilus ATPase [Vulcanimicrobium alpinum]BDE06626.1 twitching motility protein PilT [Vulcanimicrobium alpinum]